MKQFIKNQNVFLFLTAWAIVVGVLFAIFGTNEYDVRATINGWYWVCQAVLCVLPLIEGYLFDKYGDDNKFLLATIVALTFFASIANFKWHTPPIF